MILIITKILIGKIQNEISKNGYITIADECCGSGRMLFAYLKLLKETNVDLNNIYFEEEIGRAHV